MKRKTKNTCLISVIKIQEREIARLNAEITTLKLKEQARDDVWAQHTDDRIKEINTAIRKSNTPKEKK